MKANTRSGTDLDTFVVPHGCGLRLLHELEMFRLVPQFVGGLVLFRTLTTGFLIETPMRFRLMLSSMSAAAAVVTK